MTTIDAVNEWLDDNWDAELELGEWWRILADSGWGYASWPTEWFGRGLSNREARAARNEMQRRGVMGPPTGIGAFLAAPTLLTHGSDDLKAKFLPGIARGTETWCQLFSEPGSGSDLASLATRAERDGDEYVVTGQKVWNTGAQYADWAILIARTDPDQPKHRGMSYFAFDMRQDGVEVRPLKEMTGGATFNEVFLTEARVPADHLLGSFNEGWRVAMTTLSHERDAENMASGGGGGAFIGRIDLGQRVAEAMAPVERSAPDGFELSMNGGVAGLPRQAAVERGLDQEPVARQDLMRVHTTRQVMRFNGLRAKAKRAAGQPPGAESSTGKLLGSHLGRQVRDVGLAMEGPHGQLLGADAPLDGALQAYGLFTPANSIAGGTDEVQRNIIGERVLGLPKEPDVSRDLPYRELKVGTQRGGAASER